MDKKKLLLFLVPLLAIGLVSAGLLNYYGRIRTIVPVHQSIKLLGPDGNWLQCNPDYQDCTVTHEIPEESPGGEKFCFKHKLINQMSVDGTVGFENSCSAVDKNGNPMNCNGVIKTHYGIPMETTLVLENKDENWNVIDDETTATLTFDTVGNDGKFNYDLEVESLTPNTEYALIYYADKSDRFENWGGDNPGKLITTFMTDANGDYSGTGSPDINMNLPSEPDANIDEYDYSGDPDHYAHAHGAKIWIVPVIDYSEPSLTAWNPDKYLFETDLIVYLDCDLGVEAYFQDLLGESVTSLTIPSKEVQDFIICYEFAPEIMPGTYTLTTDIVPT